MKRQNKGATPCELPQEALLFVSQAAKILNVNRAFVARLIVKRELPVLWVGTQRRIPRWALRQYEERKVQEEQEAYNRIAHMMERRVA